MTKDQIAERAQRIAKDAYAIYRGQFREGAVPPHWDELDFKQRLAFTFTASEAYWAGRTEARNQFQ